MPIPTLEDLEQRLGGLAGKRILVRTDFNVPLDGEAITDDFRIRAALPTINWLTERGANVVTASHLGRPKGKPAPEFAMEPVRRRLAELAPGVELVENLRFDPGEEANDPGFTKKARGRHRRLRQRRVRCVCIAPTPRSSDRHSTSRRRWAGCCNARSRCCCRCASRPKRPFVAVLGGAKISDKLGVVEALLDTVDSLVIGGAMCFTFFAAQGRSIGESLFEPDQVDTCKRLLETGKDLHLPTDIIGLDAAGNLATWGSRVPEGGKGLDIGPGSAAEFADVITEARTVFWNGPMGMFEDPASPLELAPSPRPWRRRRPSPSSVAATRQRPLPSSDSTTRSIMCRRAAGPHSSCWNSAICQDSPPSVARWPSDSSTAHLR